MSHSIAGFAGPFGPLAAAAVLGGRAVARLGHGWGFLPVEPTGAAPDRAFPMFRHLTPGLSAWAARASKRSPLVYLETVYFGGVGQQAAAAWVGGAVVARGVTRDRVLDAQPGWAINAAARTAGLTLGPDDGDADEFDALGLGGHRRNDGWADSAAWTALAARVAADPPEPAPAAARSVWFRPVPVPTGPDLDRHPVWAGMAVTVVLGMFWGVYASSPGKPRPTPPAPPAPQTTTPADLAWVLRPRVAPPGVTRAEMSERLAHTRALIGDAAVHRLLDELYPPPAGECVPVGRFVVRK